MKRIGVYLIILLLALGIIVGVPIVLINMPLLAQDDSFSNLLAFGGSYWGGILGGICTLAGVIVTLKVSKEGSMKPFLTINFAEEEVLIQNPEEYSKANNLKGLMKYASLPLISQLCNIKIVNSGKGNAKDIDITMLIKRDDALLTNNNLLFLNMSRLPDEQVKLVNDNYVQKAHVTYIKQENGECLLPINIALNGIVFSSIWNISYFANLNENDFSNSIDTYYKKKNRLPMTIPEIFILIEYSDLNGKRYCSLFRLGFKLYAHLLGQGVIIKPFLYYEKTSKSVKFRQAMREKKQKEDKVTIKEKRIANKLEMWQGYIYEVAMMLNLTDDEAYVVCRDSSMRRYFLNYLKYGRGLSWELVIIFLYCCMDREIQLDCDDRVIDIILMARDRLIKNKKIRLTYKKDRQVLSDKIRDDLLKLAQNKEELCRAYFNLYVCSDKQNKKNMMISKGKFSVKIAVSKDLKMQCGFYRLGYSYRLVENQETVRSVIQHTYDNVEVGFLDEKGLYYEGKEKWDCIYLR